MLTLLILVYVIKISKIKTAFNISFQNIYTLLGLALMVCTQFELERKLTP